MLSDLGNLLTLAPSRCSINECRRGEGEREGGEERTREGGEDWAGKGEGGKEGRDFIFLSTPF